MNKKGIYYSLLFILLTFGLFEALYFFNFTTVEQRLRLPLHIIPSIYVFYLIVSGIKYIFKKKRNEAVLSILAAFLIIQLWIKITFLYYHFALALLLVIISYNLIQSISETSSKRSELLKSFCIILIGINVLLVLTPDILVFKHIHQKRIWNEHLNFKDFPNRKSDSEIIGGVTTGIRWKVNRVYNFPQQVSVTTVDRNRNWLNTNMDSSKLVLGIKHLEGHTDISEMFRRKALDSIGGNWGRNPESIKEVFSYFMIKSQELRETYSSQTDSGLDTVNQKKWIKLIQDEIKKTKS